MKSKFCASCKTENTVLFRVQIEKGKDWLFVCKICCEKYQKLEHYKYGGTWKGTRH